MALPTNSFRPKRYFRSKFREGKYLLAAEASDLQLEVHDLLREFIKLSYGDIAVQTSWKADQISLTQLRLRPGSAWDGGIPFLMKSGTDPKIIAGSLPTGLTFTESSATTLDAGGKNLNLSGALADNTYSVVLEGTEEVVRPVGTGAVDPYLQGVNVGEETANKARLIYKTHVILSSELTSSPNFPLSPTAKHFVNEISVTPPPGFLLASVPITQDANGADIRITLDNALAKLPFSTDAQDYINGIFVDSDGNEMTITSISTTDAGATVQILLDREIDFNSPLPKAAVPVITTSIPIRLIKRDFYVSASSGTPLGRHYYRIAEFSSVAGSLTSLTDRRIVSGVNTFGVDHNVRLVGGGLISWSTGTNLVTFDTDFQISIPGLVGRAIIDSPPGTVSLPLDGQVAFVYLNRRATADYVVAPIVVLKENVPPSVDVYVVMERKSSRIFFPHNGSIGDGETGILGAFGATLDKDFSQDLIIDALTENQMDEVFAETFDNQNNVDLANTVGMIYEPFSKQYKATAAARYLNYEADVLPDDGSLPVDEIWTQVGSQLDAVGGGLLTLTDTSVGDQIAYQRTESNQTTLSQADHEVRCRLTSNGGQGGNYFLYEIKDGASGKHFALGIKSTSADLVDGAGLVLISAVVNTAVMHTYRIVKLGNSVIQLYVDNVLYGTFPYASIVTGSGGASTIKWGTTIPTTSVVDLDFVHFNIYLSILQSFDVFRKGNVFYNGYIIPTSDAAPWVKIGGGGGITETITNKKLVLVDGSAADLINYERVESSLIRQGDAQIEMRLKINAGYSAFQRFGIRIKDGKKDVAAYIRDVAGQLKVGMYDGASFTLISNEYNIPTGDFVVIKLKKLRDVGYQLFVDGLIKDSNAYDEFSDTTTDKKFMWGSYDVLSNYTTTVDFTQYSLPGSENLAGTPVHDFMTIVSSDDPFPKVWASTDDGYTWYESLEGEHTSITDYDTAGGNILVRIMLSKLDSVLTDYGILYNRTNFEVEGQFNYTKYIAVGGETVVPLPFTYNPGSNELEVFYRPFSSGETRKLTLPNDYTEPNQSNILIGFALALGDIIEARNSFIPDPLIPPPVRFLDHDHDGSHGESDVLNPTLINVTDLNVSNDLDVGGDLTVAGTINGTSPLELSGDNTGVLVGDDTLAVGTLELALRTAAGGTPSMKLKRGTTDWKWQINSSGDIELYVGGILRMSMPDGSDFRIHTITPDITNSFYIRSNDLSGNGDSKIVLEVNNGANSWDINLDNSDSDKLKFSYNGLEKKIFHSGTTPSGTSAGLGELAKSAGSGLFSTSSSSYTNVTNLSVTIVTSGRPVMIRLQESGGVVGNLSGGVQVDANSSDSTHGSISFLRDGNQIQESNLFTFNDNTGSNEQYYPSSAFSVIDLPAAGTYTYSVQARIQGSTDDIDVQATLVVIEL